MDFLNQLIQSTVECPNCHTQVKSDMNFCPRCGMPMSGVSTVKAAPARRTPVERFMHDDDRKAMAALKAIPGFSALMKGFLNIWSEKQFRIQNMSTNIKLGPDQLPQYYNMLFPICDKLEIELPELYLTLNVTPNAYTYGDTKPFIVITSGLLKTVPMELIPTVLAHECGHIACRHTLYTTMGRLILGGANIYGAFSQIGKLISMPLELAFFHWMRCSEFSSDRAAAYYNGGSSQVTDLCLCLAGLDKDIVGSCSKELFMQQAIAYKELIASSAWNKTLEFLMLKDSSHPFNAVRAYECDHWARSEDFRELMAGR